MTEVLSIVERTSKHESGRGASTLALKTDTCMHRKVLPGEWLLNFSVCSNELSWESLAQNQMHHWRDSIDNL